MFSFLNSAMLIATAAAVIPLLIHLFSKRKMKVVPFSSLKYLQELQKRQVRRVKIQQLLLLALRTLILLLAALAFARPVTQSGYLGANADVSAVVLMDVSASMSQETPDGPLFETSRRHAESILSTLSEGDEVALIPFGSGTDDVPAVFVSRDRANQILNEMTVGQGRADINDGLARGLEALSRAQSFNREVYLLTDFQANSVIDSAQIARRILDSLGGEVRFYAVDLSADARDQTEPQNVGLTAVDFGGQLIEAGAPFTIGFTAKNYDEVNKSGLIASLFIDGQRVSQIDFTLTSGEEKRGTFTYTVPRPGRHRGRVELSGDDFSADNQLNFAFHIPETFNILIVDNNAGGEYLRMALEPTPTGVRHWRMKLITADRLGAVDIDEYNVVALVGLTEISRSESAALARFIRRGSGVIYVAGPGLEPSRFNDALGELTGLRLVEEIQVNPPGSGYYTLDQINFTHPIFHPFGPLYESGMPTFEFYTTPRFESGSENTTLAQFSGNRPALVERRLGRGKILSFAGILRPEYSRFMAHSFFVPFTIRLAEYAASDLSRYDYQRYVGQEAVIPLPPQIDPNTPVTIKTPDEMTEYVQAVENGGAYEVRLANLKQTGIYELRSGGTVFEQFAVNVEPAEGALSSTGLDGAGRSLGVELAELPSPQSTASFLSEKRTGSEIWRTLLWLVAIALVVETLLAGDIFRRKEVSE